MKMSALLEPEILQAINAHARANRISRTRAVTVAVSEYLGVPPPPLKSRGDFRRLSFWDRVEKTSSCWLWTGAKDRQKGYGMVARGGRMRSAHRFAFELVKGEIPPGHHIHHLCGVRACCNPEHLEPLTPGEHRRAHREEPKRAGRPRVVKKSPKA